jgi:3-methylfumaryl-CoA hydratase
MAENAWIGRSEECRDQVPSELTPRLLATLDLVPPAGDAIPPLGHWLLFQDWQKPEALGPDGHPKRGGFLPPLHDLPRRMWAGGRIEFRGELRAGMALRRRSTIAAIEEKEGASGRLVFVTVRHEIAGPGDAGLVEEHDLVYRGTEGAAVKPAEPAPAPPGGSLVREILPDSVMLFRYSALTGNGHRIHYDLDYARGVELYPGLVVHGPLQATLLADLALRLDPGRRLRRFSFRGKRPAFHGCRLRLEGWHETAGVRLRTRDESGAECMSAAAELG